MAKVDLLLVPTALHHYTVQEIEAEEKTNDTASTLTLILHSQCTAEACCHVFLVREEWSDTKVKTGQDWGVVHAAMNKVCPQGKIVYVNPCGLCSC